MSMFCVSDEGSNSVNSSAGDSKNRTDQVCLESLEDVAKKPSPVHARTPGKHQDS
ncbi:MAG: hypothetical protein JWO96_602 [Candidatus Saccharibacteria bacterium]|nr:hypothetical protein [Candidatus Saccharibacteria bacterium]